MLKAHVVMASWLLDTEPWANNIVVNMPVHDQMPSALRLRCEVFRSNVALESEES